MMRSPIGWRRSPQARFSGGNTLWAGYRIYVEGVLMAWTDERIDQLKSMWEKGMTASQIADELGGVSRNAVIGKARAEERRVGTVCVSTCSSRWSPEH